MAAVLACGDGACLSHDTACQNFEVRPVARGPIHIAVPKRRNPRLRGIVAHRRDLATDDARTHARIPTTTAVIALVDVAPRPDRPELERAIGEADRLGQQRMGQHRMHFHWPGLGLVVETDGLTYHRTAAQQGEDLRPDQADVAAGLTVLRFSHAQVRFEPAHVEATLAATVARLSVP